MNVSDDFFKYSLKTIGYCKIQNCIKDLKLIEKLKSDLDNACEQDKKSIKSYDNYRFYDIIHHLIDRSHNFIKLIEMDVLNHYVHQALDKNAVIHSYNGVKLMPSRGNNATKIHRDSQRFYSQSYPLLIQAIICLDHFTKENGATYLLPASHHVEEKPSDKFFYDHAERVLASPGDVIFFDSLVWHAGGSNQTETPRRALTVVYSRSFMKQQIDLSRSLSSNVINSLSDTGKRLIGMNVRVPSNKMEFYLPENERLYKPNQG